MRGGVLRDPNPRERGICGTKWAAPAAMGNNAAGGSSPMELERNRTGKNAIHEKPSTVGERLSPMVVVAGVTAKAIGLIP